MKLFSLFLAATSADFGDPVYPQDLWICDAERDRHGENINGRFVKHEGPLNGKPFWRNADDDDLVIFWYSPTNTWLMNRQLGANEGFYKLASEHIMSPNVAWTFSEWTNINPDAPNGWEHSNMRAGYFEGCFCATIYDAAKLDSERFRVINPGQDTTKLKKFPGEKKPWNNKASMVRVQKNCAFQGYNGANFKNMLVSLTGDDYVFEGKQNNKLTSYSCTCYSGEKGCFNKYYGDAEPERSCPRPQCDIGEYKLVDSWKVTHGGHSQYGFVASVTLPESENDKDGDGWVVVLRWPQIAGFGGNIAAYNAKFWQVFQKDGVGTEVAIDVDTAFEDTTDPNTFTIVGNNMNSAININPEIFFFRKKSSQYTCFVPPITNGDRSSQAPIIENAEKRNIQKIRFNTDGSVKLFD